MKLVLALAAAAALWAQPASAGVIISATGPGSLLTQPGCTTLPCSLPILVSDGFYSVLAAVPDSAISGAAFQLTDTTGTLGCPFQACQVIGTFSGGLNLLSYSLPDQPFGEFQFSGAIVQLSPADVQSASISISSTPLVPFVPEPSTWAMMLLGFGFIGGAMRQAKRRQKLTICYA